MATIMRDVRYAARLLVREPGFAAVVLMTIALGIGGATAIFSVVHAVLLRSLPYNDESRIVMVWETEPAAGVDEPQRFTRLRMLPSGSLNQATFMSPCTCRSPSRFVSGKS